jgi:hypothetical protein
MQAERDREARQRAAAQVGGRRALGLRDWRWLRRRGSGGQKQQAGGRCKSSRSSGWARCQVSWPPKRPVALASFETATRPPTPAPPRQAEARQRQFEQSAVGRAAIKSVANAKKVEQRPSGGAAAGDWLS